MDIFGNTKKETTFVETKEEKNNINLKYIVETLLINRKEFGKIEHSDKEKFGFIINRMLGRYYPEFAQKINIRSGSGDFGMVLNMWWLYLKDKPKTYYNIWARGKMPKNDIDYYKELIDDRELKEEDIIYLRQWYEGFDDYIKYLEKIKEDYEL